MRNPFKRHPDYPFQTWRAVAGELVLALAFSYLLVVGLAYIIWREWDFLGVATSGSAAAVGATVGVVWGIRRDRRKGARTRPSGDGEVNSKRSVSRRP